MLLHTKACWSSCLYLLSIYLTVLGSKVHIATLSLLCESWGLNSGSWAYKVPTLTCWASAQPQICGLWFLNFYIYRLEIMITLEWTKLVKYESWIKFLRLLNSIIVIIQIFEFHLGVEKGFQHPLNPQTTYKMRSTSRKWKIPFLSHIVKLQITHK